MHDRKGADELERKVSQAAWWSMMQSSAAPHYLMPCFLPFSPFFSATQLCWSKRRTGRACFSSNKHDFRCGCPVPSMRGEALHWLHRLSDLSIRACNNFVFFSFDPSIILLLNPLTHLYVVGCWVCLLVSCHQLRRLTDQQFSSPWDDDDPACISILSSKYQQCCATDLHRAWIWITWIGADILSRLWHLSLTRSEPDFSKMLLFSQLLVNYPSDILHDVDWPSCIADLVNLMCFLLTQLCCGLFDCEIWIVNLEVLFQPRQFGWVWLG